MRFEILGESPTSKLSPPGPESGRLRDCGEFTGVAAGENERALPVYDYSMAQSAPLSYIGMRPQGSAKRNSRSSTCFDIMAKTQAKQLVVCVDNEGYTASLEKRKIYVALRDAAAEKHGMLPVVDESGEDYLYPKALFRPIALPQAVKRAVLAA
jgi:hypothetical protein